MRSRKSSTVKNHNCVGPPFIPNATMGPRLNKATSMQAKKAVLGLPKAYFGFDDSAVAPPTGLSGFCQRLAKL